MTEASETGSPSLEPPANPELIGHGAAEATLLRALQSGRLPHAWLITGPRGVGKATLAFRFARFLLAGGGAPDLFGGAPVDLALDRSDPVFQRVAAGGHPDLRTGLKDGNRTALLHYPDWTVPVKWPNT